MKIGIVGLGYVGLPLAVAFSKQFTVIGFDISEKRVSELSKGSDVTNSVSKEDLKSLTLTTDPALLASCDVVCITVPTPIDDNNGPDLAPLKAASETVGKNLKRGAIVVYESTVYPGATEEVCIPLLEQHSGMKCNQDFSVGYSPERINPGDELHTLKTITKVIAASNKEALDKICDVYGKVVDNLYRAPSLKVAEAAKVIENTQRDLNIALMNELALIFDRIGIDTKQVLDAAATKWNFHKYSPGFVGGHCISVDPHYLIAKARSLGYEPQVILAGRGVNDYIPKFLAEKLLERLQKGARVLVAGLTFKENIPDLRNSKVRLLIDALKEKGIVVEGHDPLVSSSQIDSFGISAVAKEHLSSYDAIVIAAPHDIFKQYDFTAMVNPGGVVVDVRRMLDRKDVEEKGLVYITL